MLALDFALFVRDASKDLNLSLANLGVAYTLAFRIGTNINTWVSQEALAKEMNLHETNVSLHCQKLQEAKIIVIKKSSIDKRKNVYSFNKLLYNYAQHDDRKRKKCLVKILGIKVDTQRNHCLNEQRNHCVSSGDESLAGPVNAGLAPIENSPKRKNKENIKTKRKEKVVVDNFELPDWVDKEVWSNFEKHRKEIKKPMTTQAKKVCLTDLEKLKNEGHDPKDVLNQSILCGWIGVFEIKTYSKPHNNPRYTQDTKQCGGCKRSQNHCECAKPTRCTVSPEMASYFSEDFLKFNNMG